MDTKKGVVSVDRVMTWLEEVVDPELPVLSVVDLGIIRAVNLHGSSVEVVVTPTYSGCPAMELLREQIRELLLGKGFQEVTLKTILSPAWTTEWMSESGKTKLKAYGIAPPNTVQQVCKPEYFRQEEALQCPRCDSFRTHRVSEFGSTACKSLHFCNNCQEPFEHFKCH